MAELLGTVRVHLRIVGGSGMAVVAAALASACGGTASVAVELAGAGAAAAGGTACIARIAFVDLSYGDFLDEVEGLL